MAGARRTAIRTRKEEIAGTGIEVDGVLRGGRADRDLAVPELLGVVRQRVATRVGALLRVLERLRERVGVASVALVVREATLNLAAGRVSVICKGEDSIGKTDATEDLMLALSFAASTVPSARREPERLAKSMATPFLGAGDGRAAVRKGSAAMTTAVEKYMTGEDR